jgi:hypothetical protein
MLKAARSSSFAGVTFNLVSPNSHRLGRVASALAALVVVATLTGPALAASAAKTSSKSTTTTTTPSLKCTAAQLSYTGPNPISPQAGAQAFTVAITNVSMHLCQIRGYPLVHFYTSGGRLLTFTYRHTSTFFTRTTSKLLNLAPHGHAYFEVAKSRCTTGNRYLSSFFYVRAPSIGGAPWVGHDSGAGSAQLGYCKGSSHGPGQVLGVSALVSSPTKL